MGNNSAYAAWEETVIAIYNRGALDAELLADLMEPYRGTDIDSGGSRDLTAKDGLDVEQIVLKTFGVEYPERPELPADWPQWTDEDQDANDRYHDRMGELFHGVIKRFGWC